MNRNRVEVVPYNMEWQKMFEAEEVFIKKALRENCLMVHHIGSTAVPGLKAKAIIDMIAVVRDIMKVDEANEAMTQLGYEARGENGMLFRRYFEKGGEVRTHNVHVYEEENSEIERHLKFRDWMRTHSDDRDLYERLKEDLALKYPHDILSYCFGKDIFVASIDAKTGYNGLRVVKALTPCEWDAVKRYREKNLGKVAVSHLYSHIGGFDQKEHLCFVLYQGSEIIGYADIQLQSEKRAIIWVIFIDEPYHNQGIEGKFLAICQRWLEQKGYTV